MGVSALLMGVCGVVLQFFPHELLRHFGLPADGALPVLSQVLSALYLGFATTNWMAKGVVVGGIYARPLALGNFMHFTVGAFALLKFASSAEQSRSIWIAGTMYALLAILFGIVAFTHPTAKG